MKRIIGLLSTIVVFGCLSNNESENNTETQVPDTTINWSLSGVFGVASLDSVNNDTAFSYMVSRTDSSMVHLNGYDSTYMQSTILLTHLQNATSVRATVDSAGNFKFSNSHVFGYSDGGNSIRITPLAKEHVILSPLSFILFSNF